MLGGKEFQFNWIWVFSLNFEPFVGLDNSGIEELRDLGINRIFSILIPEFPNS
jgi:hypothetical protein